MVAKQLLEAQQAKTDAVAAKEAECVQLRMATEGLRTALQQQGGDQERFATLQAEHQTAVSNCVLLRNETEQLRNELAQQKLRMDAEKEKAEAGLYSLHAVEKAELSKKFHDAESARAAAEQSKLEAVAAKDKECANLRVETERLRGVMQQQGGVQERFASLQSDHQAKEAECVMLRTEADKLRGALKQQKEIARVEVVAEREKSSALVAKQVAEAEKAAESFAAAKEVECVRLRAESDRLRDALQQEERLRKAARDLRIAGVGERVRATGRAVHMHAACARVRV